MPAPDFTYTWRREEAPEEAWQAISVDTTAVLTRMGFQPTMHSLRGGTFTRRYSPAVFIVLYIILFPLGLLFLLARPTQTVSIEVSPAEDGGSIVTARGANENAERFFRTVATGEEP